jgi:hypothetical protein
VSPAGIVFTSGQGWLRRGLGRQISPRQVASPGQPGEKHHRPGLGTQVPRPPAVAGRLTRHRPGESRPHETEGLQDHPTQPGRQTRALPSRSWPIFRAERDGSAREFRGLGRSSGYRPVAQPSKMAPGTKGASMSDQEVKSELLGLTAKIVAAHLSKNVVPFADLPALIRSVHDALASTVAEPAPEPKPAVPVKKSVTPSHLVCLEDGKKFRTLRRHLTTAHGMSPHDARTTTVSGGAWHQTIPWRRPPLPSSAASSPRQPASDSDRPSLSPSPSPGSGVLRHSRVETVPMVTAIARPHGRYVI